ncbi:MAG TPA: SusC/RagA family TonB-linked outer membrane protein [Saprospiraceae bacterium]|nr:SusC/RagA family TonB-linked outer membrane protein [Saprospiraceae bacterium]
MKRFFVKWSYSLLLVCVMVVTGLSQRTVTGIVTDASDGEALIGANILVKGTLRGTITDIDGSYSINADLGEILVFSYTGYGTLEVAIGSADRYDVSLTQGQILDEIVVTGYGTQRAKEVTSAVVSVGREEFNQGPIADPMQLLQGKVSGLQIYNRGGDPNTPSVVRLRGLSTVGANVEPLYVIDGIIGASIQNLDPNDIESMDVLKDGSAAAIYGSRGSSGVIIITTKRGTKKDGRIRMSYSGQVGASSVLRGHPIMTPDEFVAVGGVDLGARTLWLDEVTRTGITQVHGLSAEGGQGNTSYRVSANLRQVDGILRTSGFDQLNTRLNLTTKALNDKLAIDFNTSFTQRDQNFAFNEAFRYAMIFNPTAPVSGADSPFPFNADQFGGYFEMLGLFDAFNPVSIIDQNQNLGKRVEFNYGANLGYSFSEKFTGYFRIAQQTNTSNNRQYFPTTSHFRGNATSPVRKGLVSMYNDESRFSLYEAYGTYLTSFGNSNLTLTGGYSFQQNNFENRFFEIGDFPDNSINWSFRIQDAQDLQNAGFINANSTASPDEKIIAFFARANYTLNDAIFVNASIRREGSTKLGPDNRWGWFPAIGVGVDLNNYLNFGGVDILKVRLGYGVTGSLPLQNGLATQLRQVINGPDGSVTTVLQRAANPDLKWEEKAETNLGIDFGMGRLKGSFDIYNRDISDFILTVPVDVAVFGAPTQTVNAGRLNTKGLELQLGYDLVRSSNLNYTTGIVLSTYRTVLTEFIVDRAIRGNLGAPGQNGTDMILVEEGAPIGQIWGPVFDRVGENGAPIFKDINEDGMIISDQDRWNDPNADFEVLGRGIPTMELGWTNNLNIKGWNINAFFRGAFGHSLVNTFRAFYEPRLASQTSYNFVNSPLAVEGLTAARFSSLYVEKADFFMLDNLTIAKNIPINSNVINNLNVGLTIQNAFVITGYTGAVPEPALVYYGAVDNGALEDRSNPDVLASGIDSRNNFFMPRTITLGVNFNF